MELDDQRIRNQLTGQICVTMGVIFLFTLAVIHDAGIKHVILLDKIEQLNLKIK